MAKTAPSVALSCPGTTSRYNVYFKDCPARLIFDRLSDKWALLVVGLLRTEPVRFNELRRRIQGISQKALSQTLRKLERDGLVARQVFATTPITVEYSLSELGRSLSIAVETLSDWAQTHVGAVHEAQQRYDQRSEKPAAPSSSPALETR